MPLNRMAILRGRPVRTLPAGEPGPHYQVELVSNGVHFRIAINARSSDGTLVQYLRKDITGTEFAKELYNKIKSDGLHTYDNKKIFGDAGPGGPRLKINLDYLRSGLVTPADVFQEVPHHVEGPANDLNDFFDEYFFPLMTNGNARVYAFGQVWGPNTEQDEYFGFLPGAGIHDIHQNQGNPLGSRFAKDNGVHQDGGLVIRLPESGPAYPERWECFLLRFSTQATATDDATGHPK